MAKGGPAKDELDSKKPPSATAKQPSATVPASGAKAPAASPVNNAAASAPPKEKKKNKEGSKNISLTEKFYCRARDIYEILMDENRWKGFSQSNARISKEVGGQFSLFDGSITGFNEQLQESKLIVQKWRIGSWPDGIYSTVRLTFEEPEQGITIVKLTQNAIPEEDKYVREFNSRGEHRKRMERDLIFHKIRAVFGFGM